MTSVVDGQGAWARLTEHVGLTVADLDRSIAFWTTLTGGELLSRRVLQGSHIGELVGYPGIEIEIALLALPGGLELELLRYLGNDDTPYDVGTAHPGNVHMCFVVDDLGRTWAHAVECGAVPASSEPVVIPAGPHRGARVAYLRTPDGISIELRQPGDADQTGARSSGS